MKTQIIILLTASLTLMSFSSDKPAYRLFNQDGKEVKYNKMLNELQDADIIFFGELHTDPIAHWMQLELAQALFAEKTTDLVLGAEMFEADNQLILDEYLGDYYPASKFEAEMRLWNNYQTDYKPLVEFARVHKIPFIATNIPRRYASMVHAGGFEALDKVSEEAKRYIAPLPIAYDPEVKCYKDMLNMGEMGAPEETEEDSLKMETTAMDSTEAPGAMPAIHGPGTGSLNMENLPKAQAIKDATMAHFILENWSEGQTFFHLNGSYHSNYHQGIIWHLQQKNSKVKILTINTVLQKDINTLDEEYLESADYIICVPEKMTRTGR